MKMEFEENGFNSTRNLSIFTFDSVSNRSIKDNEENENEIEENITYEESEVRLITLGCISALILLTCATAFMLITIRVVGTYRDPITIEYKYKQPLGFPIPKLLFMDYSGHYVVYSPLFNTLEKLPNLKKIPRSHQKNYFGVRYNEDELYKIFTAEYKQNLYFLYSDQSSKVIRYNLETKNHRVINEFDSSSINIHMTASSGIQIGKYFWIILGEEVEKLKDLTPQYQSSIWHLEKERWFQGPNLKNLKDLPGISEQLSITDYCIVSVGKNTAYIMVGVYLLSYNFDSLQWTNHSGIHPFWEPNNIWLSLSFNTCAFFQDKMYRRYIYACGIAEYQDSILRWEILKYNLDTDAWISISKYSNTEKYAGLTTQFQGNLIQIFQSESLGNVEISKIIPLNYKQKILLSTNNSIEFDLFLEDQLQRFHTVSTFHARNYCKDYYLK